MAAFAGVPLTLATAGITSPCRAAAAVVGLNFPGVGQRTLPSTDVVPPDVSGAAGPLHLAQFVNGAFATYDKSDGARAALVSDRQFWLNAGADAGLVDAGVARPRILYDHPSGRWFALQRTGHDLDNSVLLAVSAGTDPDPAAGNWRAAVIPGAPADKGQAGRYRYVDFPTLGLDANGVYVGTINAMSSAGGADNSNSLFSVPKADLTGPAGPSLANLTAFHGTTGNYENLGFVLQPAVDFAAAKPQRAAAFAANYTMFGRINRADVLGPSGPGATLAPAPEPITVRDTHFPTSPRQPDGTGGPGDPTGGITAHDDRLASTVYQVGDRVYLAHMVGTPTESPERSAVRWTVLRLAGGSTEVLQEGTIEDPDFDFFTPAIAANERGDVVIGYNRSGGGGGGSGPGGSIDSFFSVGETDAAGLLTFGTPQRATDSGVAGYHNAPDPDAWGEYSAVTVDPLDPSVFWSFQQVPLDGDTWGTQVTQIIVPEPGTAGLVALCAGVVARRRRATVRVRLPRPA
jgi:hypothetical protein